MKNFLSIILGALGLGAVYLKSKNSDTIFGGSGNETLDGGNSNETLGGGANNDYLGVEQIAGSDIVKGLNPNPVSKVSTYDDIYKAKGRKYNVDWKLIKAHAIVESGENPNAVNPNDPSYGMMQVLCVHKAGTKVCTNKFPAVSNWSGATIDNLKMADYNVDIATQIIRWNLGYAKNDYDRAISLYNDYNSGKLGQGSIRNWDYVNKVKKAYSTIKE